MAAVNESLRAHVTRVGFDLTLAKSAIAALVYIDQVLRNNRDAHAVEEPRTGPMGRTFSHFATGTKGLIERGLVRHVDPGPGSGARSYRVDLDGTTHFYWAPNTYRITKAGRLVIGLLHETGIYEEYAKHLQIRGQEKTA